jgi:poly(hydroxyalkanoate) depolymerase family esterase
MNPEFRAAILQALQLTRSQNVMEATRVIQRAIADLQRPAPPVDEPRERAPALPPPPEVTRTADAVEPPPQPFLNTDSTMKTDFSAAMRQALQLTRAQNVQNVMEATRVIQRALAGRSPAAPPVDEPWERAPALPPPPEVTRTADAVEPPQQRAHTANSGEAATERRPSGRPRRRLGDVLKLLRQAELSGLGRGAAPLPGLRKAPTVVAPEGAAYLGRSFACAAGARDYKVYVPSGAEGRALPLIVMLHGCTQHPDDFAVGTGMNRLAEERGFIVAYPEQPSSANLAACWNWFDLAHQKRDEGEPAILAGVTRAVMAEFAVDPARVYVAGLSAGGAMAAILSATYPELYAAAGVHSGLPHGAAADVPSGLAAMRGAGLAAPRKGRANGRVRTIVFHGANDKIVNPSNAEAILADVRAALSEPAQELLLDGVAGGRAYTRTIVTDARGVPHAECWAIDGLGHAWSGGIPEGSFTDAQGPDASREMLRFFLEATPREGVPCVSS